MTVAQFLTYVKNDYRRTDKDTEILQAYNDAVTKVSIAMPLGDYKYQSYVSLVQYQEDYPLPDDIIHLLHPIRLLEGTASDDEGYPLNKITKLEYDERYPNPNSATPDNTGTPIDYTVYSRSILVGPYPEASNITDGYLLEINWTKKESTLDEDVTTTKSLGSEWDKVLKQMVMADVYDGIELYQEGSYWRAKFEDQRGDPIGDYKKLLDREKDIEGSAIGRVQNNPL